MNSGKNTLMLTHLPSFCLLVVSSILPISQSFTLSKFYPFINLLVVLFGSHFLKFLTHRFGIFRNSLILGIAMLMTAIVPVLINYLSLANLGIQDLFISSLCLGFSWIAADIERKSGCQLTSSLGRFVRVLITFTFVVLVAAIFRVYFGQEMGSEHNVLYQVLGSPYWSSLSGGFIVCGLLLLGLEATEKLLSKQKSQNLREMQ